MTTRPALQIVGGREFRRALRQADGNLKRMSAVHRDVADVVTAAAIAGAPVLTGALRSTIRASATTTSARVAAGGRPRRGTYYRLSKPDKSGRRRRTSQQITTVAYADKIERYQKFLSRPVAETETTWLAVYRRGVADAVRVVEQSRPTS
jgi:hypothetical protein